MAIRDILFLVSIFFNFVMLWIIWHPFSKWDGELDIFEEKDKDTFRIIVYDDIYKLKTKESLSLKIVMRENNIANNENVRKETFYENQNKEI